MFILILIVLSVIACDPQKDVPAESKKLYEKALDIMEAGKNPPPIVQDYFNKIKKDSL